LDREKVTHNLIFRRKGELLLTAMRGEMVRDFFLSKWLENGRRTLILVFFTKLYAKEGGVQTLSFRHLKKKEKRMRK